MIARWTAPEVDGPGDGLVVLLVPVDLIDIGDADAVEAGGVGIDDGLRLFVGATEAFDLPPLGWADCVGALEEEEGVEEEVSFNPQEARTLFSTLTVSSRNINDSWSL